MFCNATQNRGGGGGALPNTAGLASVRGPGLPAVAARGRRISVKGHRRAIPRACRQQLRWRDVEGCPRREACGENGAALLRGSKFPESLIGETINE